MDLTPRRRLIVLVAVSTMAALTGLGRATPVAAADFIVGSCSTSQVIADIEAANSEIDNPGGDTIVLKSGCTYSFGVAYAPGYALPTIDSAITIIGHGARIERAAGASSFGLFSVARSGTLLLSDLTLAEGTSGSSNGANLNNGGSATLNDVTITHSIPLGQGGPGVYNHASGVLAIIGSTIENQSAGDGSASALENEGDLTITGSTIEGNTRASALSSTGTVVIYSSTFAHNIGEFVGGAIKNAGSLEIHDSSFVDNQVANFGGAIYNSSDLVVDGSYFTGSRASIEGGAIYNGNEALAQVVNTTFYSNTATSPFFPCCVGGKGGAISNSHSLRIEHVTFSRNGAGSGSSIASPEGLASVEASVFDDARGGGHCTGFIADLDFNVTDFGSTCPSTFTIGDAKLSSPAVNGFGTKTLALGPGSAAVDVAPVAGCPAYDQRGVTRPQGPACDAGALEDRIPTVPGAPAVTVGGNPNNGAFSLGWTASTDPDGQPVTYRLYRRDADDAGYTSVGTAASASHAFMAENEGTMRYVVAADDGNHLSAMSAASSPIVVDRSVPSAPTGTPDRAPDAAGWYRDSVTATFSGSVDPTLQDGSAGSGVASTTSPQTRSTSGTYQITGNATDAAGNVSSDTTVSVKVDADVPNIAFTTCPADVILKSSTVASWSASDASSGLDGAASGSVPLDTATIGTRSVQISATDKVGHQTTATCAYRVIFDFTGLLAPLANPPATVDWKAGDGLTVAFSLGGDQGLGVFAAGFPQSAPVSCTTPGDQTSGDATVSQKPLDFARGQGGRYKYLWATPKAWAGTCRQLIVTFIDGTVHRANVRFK